MDTRNRWKARSKTGNGPFMRFAGARSAAGIGTMVPRTECSHCPSALRAPTPPATSAGGPLCPLPDRCTALYGARQAQGLKGPVSLCTQTRREKICTAVKTASGRTHREPPRLRRKRHARREAGNVKTLDNVFDSMTSFEWLEESYRKARKQKRYRPEVLKFTADLDTNLLCIQRQLREETYAFGPYRRHWVHIPKRRMVMALPFDGRVVQWAVYRVLKPFYHPMMIEDSYACIDGRGSLAAAQRLQYWLRQVRHREKEWYCLKLDISKYFYRIDHEILLNILRRRIRDERLMRLIETVISCGGEKFGLPRFMGPDDVPLDEWLGNVGMPIGNLTSQLFANIYLNELDQFCKHQLHAHFYARYMDDVIILSDSKEQLHTWHTQIQAFLRDKLRLDLNQKTMIFPVKKGVEFVGYIVRAGSLRIRKQTVRRIKTEFHGICGRYFAGGLSREEFQRRIASIKGLLQYTESNHLRERLNQIYMQEKEKAEMSNLQMIEELCQICRAQSEIVTAQANALEQMGAVVMEEERADVGRALEALIGCGEGRENGAYRTYIQRREGTTKM